MANEASISILLNIIKGNQFFRPAAFTYRPSVVNVGGPTPGGLIVSTAGTDVSLSQLVVPGLCLITNQDSVNFFEYGLWNGVDFMPLGEVQPGETYLIRLTRRLGKEYGTGTGTLGSGLTFRLKADTAACAGVVQAFEA